MTWNYRIVKYIGGGYGLHEVYYDKLKIPHSTTDNLCTFSGNDSEGAEGIVLSLERALNDARNHGVLDEASITFPNVGPDDSDEAT